MPSSLDVASVRGDPQTPQMPSSWPNLAKAPSSAAMAVKISSLLALFLTGNLFRFWEPPVS